MPGAYPIEYAPEIDYDKQFEKMILEPCNRIIKIIGYRSSMDIDIQEVKTGIIKTNLRYDHVTRKYILKGDE